MAAKPAPRTLPTMLHGADYNYEQWLHEPEVLEVDLRLMKRAGLNSVSIGIFSWAMLEPAEGDYRFDWLDGLMDRLAGAQIHAILATPSGARPAWMSERYPEVRRVDRHGRREPHAGRHNHCRTSPVYREKCAAMNERLARRYGEHPALLLWHVSNEYGAGTCHCDLCYAAFERWLRRRYGDLDALNQAYWATFWSHRYTAWHQVRPVDPSVPGLMLDWQRFTSDGTIDFFLAESEPLRRITPHTPVTTNFMQPDVGLDYWAFARHVDVVSWDSYPRWHIGSDARTAATTAFYHDLQRSYRGQPFLLMESTPSVTNWQGVSRPKRPGMHLLSSLQAVAHGSNSVQYFQWRQGRGGIEQFHGAVMTHANRSDTRVFEEVAEVGRALGRLPGVRETAVDARAAVVYDFETEWALRHVELPQNEAKDYQARCRAHHAALWRRGVATDVVSADAPLEPYRLVIAPMLFLLRPGVAERLEAFVANGGTLVTTYMTGLVDESTLAFMGGLPEPLRRTLGIRVEETDALPEGETQRVVPTAADAPFPASGVESTAYADVLTLEGAEALALYDREFYRGTPALTRNRHGQGIAYYLATRYGDGALDAFYGSVLGETGLAAGAEVTVAEDVSVVRRDGEGGRFVFVMNFSAEPRDVDLTALRAQGFEPLLGDADAALGPYRVVVLQGPPGGGARVAGRSGNGGSTRVDTPGPRA